MFFTRKRQPLTPAQLATEYPALFDLILTQVWASISKRMHAVAANRASAAEAVVADVTKRWEQLVLPAPIGERVPLDTLSVAARQALDELLSHAVAFEARAPATVGPTHTDMLPIARALYFDCLVPNRLVPSSVDMVVGVSWSAELCAALRRGARVTESPRAGN